MAYQDFDGKGGSRSHDKLKALRLDDFAFTSQRDKTEPLAGLAVLDIGCNEGFFCVEAARQGAARIVGIDYNADAIKSAEQRCPQGHFINATWWSLPNEKFDLIFFLSSIHYEPNQKTLLEEIARRLKPDGVLILECGVVSDPASKCWHSVKRWDAVRRYPTHRLLTEDLLSPFAVRAVGPSVLQEGDPVPRHVYHCRLKASTALLIAAESGAGKSSLGAMLEGRGIPTFETDLVLRRLMSDTRHEWRPISTALRKEFGMKTPNFAAWAAYIENQGLHDEFSELLAQECPAESSLFCIVGEALRHPKILRALTDKLRTANVRSWVVRPSQIANIST